ncbi:uridine diphosphate-N-acetylglucosamine-binding protein YvcK [Candidatus Woesearchaeota archaeon]|nr:uridine diphosphate-N-acetylglucosamine-binding protein YvcK [Candidatus Woesearchaeota archaeon]
MKEFRVVQVGGGTGLFNTLPALKQLQPWLREKDLRLRISAIVSVADDGGSTGRLRDEFGQLPPGDLRRALIALSQDTGAARKLFEYRFDKGSGLSGHSMGNLLLTALTDIYNDEYIAIRHAGRLLRVQGRVIPVTTEDTRLVATLEDGTVVRGETNIDIPKHDKTLLIKKLELDPEPTLFSEAETAIKSADMIVIGPGDLFTSLLPNILVKKFSQTVKVAREEGAAIVYISNTMTKAGETNNYSANKFLESIEEHIGKGVISHVLMNTEKPAPELLAKYEEEGADFVTPDIKREDLEVIGIPLISTKHFARHDANRLHKAYEELVEKLIK